jgi:hypothetical protein
LERTPKRGAVDGFRKGLRDEAQVIRAGLRSLEEQELAKGVREFDRVFSGSRSGEPDGKTISRIIARRKSHRKARR